RESGERPTEPQRQQRGHRGGDGHYQERLSSDRLRADVDGPAYERRDELLARSPDDAHAHLERENEPERGDRTRDGVGAAQGSDGQPLSPRADEGGRSHRSDERDRLRP